MYGYAGRLLFVDLSSGELREEPLAEEDALGFLGGYGLGARLLYRKMRPGADPLGPENVLGFLTGPATATGCGFGGRYTVVCKSPVTGGWNDSNSGGHFGGELKRAGYDAVLISGIAEAPVYLRISDGKAELRDASALWGLDAKETRIALEAEYRDGRVRSAVIGRAGERQALMAAVMNDGHRAAARGGSGAVMGSKRLKAVVVSGRGRIPVADEKGLSAMMAAVREDARELPHAASFRSAGTGGGTGDSILMGDAPTKNWAGVGVAEYSLDDAAGFSSGRLDRYKTKGYACGQCPLGCGAEYDLGEGLLLCGKIERPEYETAVAFGSMVLNKDPQSALVCNELCNRAGLDSISAGATVAWAIECYEAGLLTTEDTSGLELNWGNSPAIVEFTRQIAEGIGFGALLESGSAAAAARLGLGEEYLSTVGGIELPMHDPRLGPGLARTYQCDPTPGRHVKGGIGMDQLNMGAEKYATEGTGAADLAATARREFINCAGYCMFGQYFGGGSHLLPMISAVTGFDSATFDEVGERVLALRQAFNVREGIVPADFRLPKRAAGVPPLADGPTAGAVVDVEALAENFFASAGWDPATGKPLRERLEALGGLEDVITDLYGADREHGVDHR